jgi:hypothetical protein
MLTGLKLASYLAVAGVAAAGSFYAQPPTTPKAPTPATQPKAPAANAPRELTEQDCRDALERIREMKRQIGGIEHKLDEAQKTLSAAKGEARVDGCVKIINEMADARKEIGQKQAVIETLAQGHILEHIRAAKGFDDLQHDLNRCVLALHLERVAKGVEEEESAPKK